MHAVSRAPLNMALADMAPELMFVLGVSGAIVVVLNVYATYRVWRSEFVEGGRLVAQIAVIWVIPFIGAFAVLWPLREERFERRNYQPPGDNSDVL